MSDTTTYAPEIKDLGEKIVSLTLGKAVELADYLEKVHNIKPAAGGAVVMAAAGGGGGGAGAEAAPAKTEFTVVLDGVVAADKKISIIKVVREITGLGLKEAKDLVEGAPKNVKENVAKDEAESIKKKLEDAGAKISLK
ncbi:MAG: 50S ribosomal protein L7/L12 [Planctomycetes bacterium]|nr:50S ribosomal protein L7/L12 [Planctomycetota bacterium]NBY03083.1 50S ribosomal protein L7/L12 [Planctomycetota bacterium]